MLGFSSAVSSSGSSKTSSTGKSVKPEILADDFTVLSDKGDKVEKNILANLKLYRIKIYQNMFLPWTFSSENLQTMPRLL
jgi:hypothetical protein